MSEPPNTIPLPLPFRPAILLPVAAAAMSLASCRTAMTGSAPRDAPSLERVAVAPDGRGFVTLPSRRPFIPWGLNYGNDGRLIEDYWETDWETVAGDFREMKALGANVARVHLQLGRFMQDSESLNPVALDRLRRLLNLAEETGVYLDLTGLACYRPGDTPAWYTELDEPRRWAVQARFWEAVAAACAHTNALFCYDLLNEPLVPGEPREPGAWGSGALFGGYDFLQFVTLDPAGRTREEIALAWIETLARAIRKHDARAPITVGLLPWRSDWGHFSGFAPESIAPALDFISVHIYPETEKEGEAMEALRQCAVGKPVVIEETFPLRCGRDQLERFLLASREIACGWMGHYDGATRETLRRLEREKTITLAQALWLQWLDIFVDLKPVMTGPAGRTE